MFHKMMNYGEMEPRPAFVLTKDIVRKSMPKFKRHDDLIIIQACAWEEFKKSIPIPVVKDESNPFSIDEDELASLVCQCVQKPICQRLAIENRVKNDDFRSPGVEILLGDTGVVIHNENKISYRFDVTKCMFSFGNIREKMRMSKLDCSQEIVVDLFAGIGYFSLPLLVHAKAKHLYACEWNPDAIDSLRKNMLSNKVDSTRYTIIEGDNRSNRPTDVAQRVILGILPSCLTWMRTAFECIDKSTGAILHCHDLVEFRKENKTDTVKTSSSATEDSLSQANLDNNNTRDSGTNGLHASVQLQSQPDNSPIQLSFNSSLSADSTDSHSTIEKSVNTATPSTSARQENENERTQSGESDKDTCGSSPVLLDKPSGSSTNESTDLISNISSNSSTTSYTIFNNNSHSNNNNNTSNLLNNSTTMLTTSSKNGNANSTNSNSHDLNSSPSKGINVQPSDTGNSSAPESKSNSHEDRSEEQTEPPAPKLEDSDLSIYEARGAALIASISEEIEAHDLRASIIKIEPVKSYAPHVNHVVFDIKIEPKSANHGSDIHKLEQGQGLTSFHQDQALAITDHHDDDDEDDDQELKSHD